MGAAEFTREAVDDTRGGIQVRGVELPDHGLAAQGADLVRGPLGSGFVRVPGDADVQPRAGQGDGCCLADSRVGAGDDGGGGLERSGVLHQGLSVG
jgi:hypothetical protein